jgi:hypothetical protein
MHAFALGHMTVFFGAFLCSHLPSSPLSLIIFGYLVQPLIFLV